MNWSPYHEQWVEFATCRTIGGDVFYPEVGDPNWKRARAACLGCPVLHLCRDRVMRAELGSDVKLRFGIWAAMTPNQRKKYEPAWLAEQEAVA